MTDLTAELEKNAERILKNYLKNSFEFSFFLDKSQLHISFYLVKLFVCGKSQFWTESFLSLITNKSEHMLIMVFGQINSVSFVFKTLKIHRNPFILCYH